MLQLDYNKTLGVFLQKKLYYIGICFLLFSHQMVILYTEKQSVMLFEDY